MRGFGFTCSFTITPSVLRANIKFFYFCSFFKYYLILFTALISFVLYIKMCICIGMCKWCDYRACSIQASEVRGVCVLVTGAQLGAFVYILSDFW